MTISEIKKKVKQFKKEYNQGEVSYSSLKSVIQSQGYTIIEFNHISNSEDVNQLISALGLQSMISQSKGFTYADKSYRLVFVHEDLSEAEKLVVLAHEEGHIYFDHFSKAPIIGKDVQDEYEANEFSHYLLNQKKQSKFTVFIKKHKKAAIAVITALAIVIAGTVAYYVIKSEERYYGEYYVTSTGNKYHKKECIFVKNKNNVRRLTKEEFEEEKYEPCETCLP